MKNISRHLAHGRLLAIVSALALFPFLVGLSGRDMTAALLERYAAWDEAYRAVDIQKLDAMLDKSFRVVTGANKVNRRQDYVKNLKDGVKPDWFETKLLRTNRLSEFRVHAWTEVKSKQAGTRLRVRQYRDAW